MNKLPPTSHSNSTNITGCLKKIYSKLPKGIKGTVSPLIRLIRPSHQQSFSQAGEDVVINFLANTIGLAENWSWLDIGAHHPTYLNNTAGFYKKGRSGINVEPDPNLIKAFYKQRKRDINLNVAIAPTAGTMNFYLIDEPVLNTLSEEEARECEAMGHKILGIIPVETMTVNDIVNKYCSGSFPDLLSLDAEGYDLEILKTVNWQVSRPKIICVENIPYNSTTKNYFDSMQSNELSEYLKLNGYSIVAFTVINAIFISNDLMEKG